MMRLSLVALLAAYATAFAPGFIRTTHQSTTARHILLSEEETEAILQSSTDCIESECSVDDVSELIHDLKEQEKVLNLRLTNVMNMVSHLQHMNAKPDRKTDDVRSFVQDLLLVFDTKPSKEKSTGVVTGIDMSKGPFDAYDVLGAKPWKGPKN